MAFASRCPRNCHAERGCRETHLQKPPSFRQRVVFTVANRHIGGPNVRFRIVPRPNAPIDGAIDRTELRHGPGGDVNGFPAASLALLRLLQTVELIGQRRGVAAVQPYFPAAFAIVGAIDAETRQTAATKPRTLFMPSSLVICENGSLVPAAGGEEKSNLSTQIGSCCERICDRSCAENWKGVSIRTRGSVDKSATTGSPKNSPHSAKAQLEVRIMAPSRNTFGELEEQVAAARHDTGR